MRNYLTAIILALLMPAMGALLGIYVHAVVNAKVADTQVVIHEVEKPVIIHHYKTVYVPTIQYKDRVVEKVVTVEKIMYRDKPQPRESPPIPGTERLYKLLHEDK